ncbi:MAG TPA: hypothetical protein VIO61_16835 [Anaerolineaceae bacterium]
MAGKPEETEEKKHGLLFEATRRVLMAGIGAAYLAEEEIGGFVERLVERGELAESDARKLLREVLDKREKLAKEKRAQEEKAKSPAVTKADVEALAARIAELTRQVEELKKSKGG